MTTVHVRRVTMVWCGVFLAAAMAFAWLAERPAPPPEASAPAGPADAAGARAFAARCGACHSAEAIAQLVRDAPDRRAKIRAMGALLESGHGEAGPDDIRQILTFLEGLAAR
jgi:mono/diheme cytochrome c family protein